MDPRAYSPWEKPDSSDNELKEENEKLKQRITELEKKIRDMEIEKDNEDYNYYEMSWMLGDCYDRH